MRIAVGSIVAIAAISVAFVGKASAATIPLNASGGLWNTGVDATGTVLTYGATDPHYVIASGPDGGPLPEKAMNSTGGFPIPPWLGDDTLSDWISESSDSHGGEGSGTFDNLTTFTSPVAGTVTIMGQWSTDDSGNDILLDGVSTSNTAANFSSWYPFTITGSVVAGVNSLDFLQGQGGSPGGIRVEFLSASVTPVPEPTSMVLFCLGICGVGIAMRRRITRHAREA